MGPGVKKGAGGGGKKGKGKSGGGGKNKKGVCVRLLDACEGVVLLPVDVGAALLYVGVGVCVYTCSICVPRRAFV